jgi:hypothetical protein
VIARLLAALALTVLPVVPAHGTQATGPTVVAFVPGFTWRTEPEPLPGFAVGALVPATARRSSPCQADYWLTLSAGARAVVPDCPPPSYETAGRGVTIRGWSDVLRRNRSTHFGAHLGALAEAVRARDGCVAATGANALYGAADATGRVDEFQSTLAPSTCDVHLVDLTDRASLTTALVEVRSILQPARLVLVGLPGTDDGAHFGAVAIAGPGTTGGLLTGSPHQAGMVAIPDLTAYVAGTGGTQPVAHTSRHPVSTLLDLDRREHAHRRYQGVYLAATGILDVLLYLWVRRRRPRLTDRDGVAALLLATMPAAGFLASAVPWWRAEVLPWLACAGAAVAAMGVLTLLGVLAGRVTRAGSAVGVAGVVTALFAADLLTGSHLQRTGLPSYSAIAGGRFYGIGNVGFAVFATAAVILLRAAERRYGRRAWLAAVPLVAIDTLPRWGADFGGAIALTAAFGAAAARHAKRAVVVAATALGVAVAMAAAWLDYARPAADRTHLGAFVNDLLHGGWGDTVIRKVDANLHALTHTWSPLFLAATVAFGVWLLRRRRDPSLDTTVRTLAVLWVVGALVNDTGIVLAASGAAVAVPLLLAYEVERA